MELRIGELLVEAGVLTVGQVETVLEQQRCSVEPFGLLCERLFSVDPGMIENAWARQYARITRTIDPTAETFDPRATRLVTRRQAWQFRVLPIRFDGRDLMVATTQPFLRRALGFAVNVICVPTYLVMSDPQRLGEALCRVYDLPGMTPRSVLDNGLDGLLGRIPEMRRSNAA